MRDNKAIQAVAGTVTLCAIIATGLILRGSVSPDLQPGPHRTSGWAMARQARSLLGPGGRMVVLTRDTVTYKNPASDAQLDAFRRELGKAASDALTVQTLQVDPLRPIEVPAADYLEWIRKLPSGSVLVSFLGPPVLTPDQRRQLGQVNPAIVAFCPGNWPDRTDLRGLFDQRLLQAAVVRRRQVPSSAPKPQDPQAWFDRDFALITSANLGDLAGLTAPPSSSR